MAKISASVGLGAANVEADVITVQQLLNQVVLSLGRPLLLADGDCGSNTILAIQAFQTKVMKFSFADGRIDPGGKTWKALAKGDTPVVPAAPAPVAPATVPLSGAAWWHANQARFPNSSMLADLASPFREKVVAFVGAMKQAGANVTVSATLRHPTRAKLMLFCYQVAKGEVAPGAVPALPGCDINWDHGNTAASRRAAQEMVDLFGIVFKPSSGTSRHTIGCAIDMSIRWTNSITMLDANGAAVTLGLPRNGEANTGLHAVGASYGVMKLLSDKPHWSDNGH